MAVRVASSHPLDADVVVTPTPDDEATGRDPQLELALEILAAQAIAGSNCTVEQHGLSEPPVTLIGGARHRDQCMGYRSATKYP